MTYYTDGSYKAKKGIGAYGAIGLDENEEVQLEICGVARDTTNNVMEMTAVLELLRELNKSGTGNGAVVYCDSQYTINGLKEWYPNWVRYGWKTTSKQPVKNKELWIALYTEYEKSGVDLRWVKGHADSVGNNLVDLLVQSLADDPTLLDKF